MNFVRIKPILLDESDDTWSIIPHVKWLKENGIDRYRLPIDPWYEFGNHGTILFKFVEPEDAMAFKLSWDGENGEEK